MTVEELEIIIRANISDAISGIKQITNEVKSAVSKSIEPMKQMTTQARAVANSSASSISKIKNEMNDYKVTANSTAKQQEYLISKIKELKELLDKADMGFEVGDTQKIEADIEKLENRLYKLQQVKPKIEPEVDEEEPEQELNSLKDYIKAFAKGVINGLKEAGVLAGRGLSKGFQLAISGINTVAKKTTSAIKNIVSRSRSIGKEIGNSFNSSVKSIKKFALSLLSVRGAFTLISRAVSSYLSYNTQLSDSLQNCWNVLGSLLAPIVERLISLFSTLVSYVNAFVKALTGINLVAKANAKALNNQASATKNANKQLSGLDDLNNLTTDSGGGGGNSQNPITVQDVSIDGLIDKILNYDWYEVGLELGHKINDALASIPWDFIQKIAVALATDLSDFLNGLVDGIDWNLIGTTIGNGIQTALLFAYTFMTNFNWQNFGTAIAKALNGVFNTVDFTLLGKTLASKWVALIDWLYGFVTTFDWSKFGTSISEAVMGWWNSIDWAKAGETISTGILGLLTSISEFIANIDWQKLGNDIWKFISTIDWTGIINKLATILGQAIAGLGLLLWGFIEDAVKSIADFFSEKFEEAGGDIIAGLFNGILEIMANIGKWLWDNIFVPIYEGFKSMFGIHSPSTVFEKLGTFLVEGLKNGLLGIWNAIKGIFENLYTNIANTFTNILNKIKSIFSISAIKNHFSQVISGIKSVFSSIPEWFKSTFTKAWSNVKAVFSTGGKIFSGIKEGIENTFKTIVNKIISGINKIIAVPFNAINNMLNKIRNTSFLEISPFKGLWSQNPLKVPVIPSLAKGGLLSEETLVRVAEYSNAKSNPEIVSPVNMMKDSFRDVLEESDFGGTRIDRLTLKVLDETVFDDAIEYINEKSRIKGVSVIKGVG